MGTGIFFPMINILWHEVDYSPPPDAEVRNAWSLFSLNPLGVLVNIYDVKHAVRYGSITKQPLE
jgi:hypothetical protein